MACIVDEGRRGRVTFARLYVRDCPGYGFDPHTGGGSTTKNLLITNCVAENNGRDGVTLAGIERATVAGTVSYNNDSSLVLLPVRAYVVAGTVSYNNDRHGFNSTDTEGEMVGIFGCHGYGNAEAGLAIQNSTVETQIVSGSFTENGYGMRLGSSSGEVAYSSIQSCFIGRNDGYGINIRGSDSIAISGVTFRDNASASGNADVSLQTTQSGSVGSTYVSIVGSAFEGVSQTYGVDERSGSGPTNVVGCSFRGNYSTAVNLSNANRNDVANLT